MIVVVSCLTKPAEETIGVTTLAVALLLFTLLVEDEEESSLPVQFSSQPFHMVPITPSCGKRAPNILSYCSLLSVTISGACFVSFHSSVEGNMEMLPLNVKIANGLTFTVLEDFS